MFYNLSAAQSDSVFPKTEEKLSPAGFFKRPVAGSKGEMP